MVPGADVIALVTQDVGADVKVTGGGQPEVVPVEPDDELLELLPEEELELPVAPDEDEPEEELEEELDELELLLDGMVDAVPLSEPPPQAASSALSARPTAVNPNTLSTMTVVGR